MLIKDKYRSFAELSQAERAGVDFRVYVRRTLERVAIIAPHGGKIEPGTSEIAAAIAGHAYSLYCFEGLKRRRNTDLHITSTRFDEPRCLNLVSGCDHIVAVHGCRGRNPRVFLGGRDDDLRDAIRDRLEAAGFRTDFHSNRALQGVDPYNICNRGHRGRGVQLEVTRGLREAITDGKGDQAMIDLVSALRSAIEASKG